MGKWEVEHLDKLRHFKESIEKDYDINKMILFGSRVTDSYKRYSDFDIIIISKKFEGVDKIRRSPGLYLRWNLDYPVDFLCYTPEEFEKLSKGITIVREAMKNGVVI